jgi:peroxiredoxin
MTSNKQNLQSNAISCKKMQKSIIFTLFFALGHALLQAQEADLQFQLAGIKEPLAILADYYGGVAHKVDSARIDSSNGSFRFNTKGLKPGMYTISIDQKRLLDFIVPSPDERLSIKGDVANLYEAIVENSPQNSAFLAFEAERVRIEQRIESRKQMIGMIQRATKNDKSATKPHEEMVAAEYRRIDSLVAAYQTNHPEHLYPKMLKAVRLPESPADLPPYLDGKVNMAYLSWARQHYFDFTDFKDERMLRNKIWNIYFDNYFEQLVPAAPDSMAKAIDQVLSKMPKDSAFYRWAVVHLIQVFEQNDEPGADRLFVHLVDNYQKVKETPWLDQATLLRLEYKASVFRPVLSGNIAPDFQLQDRNGEQKSLHAIQSPKTLLVFYSPLCKHCMKEMPGIYQTWLDARKFGLAAIAVNTDNQFAYWKNFAAQQNYEWMDLADPTGENDFEKTYNNYNLPVIYLLDEEKRILRKRINPAHLREILKYYLRG